LAERAATASGVLKGGSAAADTDRVATPAPEPPRTSARPWSRPVAGFVLLFALVTSPEAGIEASLSWMSTLVLRPRRCGVSLIASGLR
jgi:hypothetical protein